MVRLVQGGVKAPCGAGLGLDRRVAAAVSTPGRASLRHSPADGVSPCRGGVARRARPDRRLVAHDACVRRCRPVARVEL